MKPKLPTHITFGHCDVDTWAQAPQVEAAAGAAEGADAAPPEQAEGSKLKSFSMVAYTGGPMDVGFGGAVVVDLEGMKVTRKARPILHQHDPSAVVGHTTSVDVVQAEDGAHLRVAGVISGAGQVAREIVEAAGNGFPWQASIGARVGKWEFVKEGDTAQANGRVWDGPVYIARGSSLSEVSFVALGADDATSASIAASAATNQEEAIMPENTEKPVAQVAAADVVAELRAAAAAESARIADIRKRCAGNGDIEAKAIAEGWDADRAELEVLRASRPVVGAPAAHIKASDMNAEVLTAAICKTGKLSTVEREFDDRTLEAADRAFPRGIGLQEVLLEAAAMNGHSARSVKGDTRGVLQAAFSTVTLPGVLSNVANKYLHASYSAVEQAWRLIAFTRSVSDFKAAPSYRLNVNSNFDEVTTGILQLGSMAEESYTNQAKTYGKLFVVNRQDIINDDLGALTQVPSQIGRAAGLKLNEVFWTAFMDNAAFFTTARKNYATGVGTALSVDSLSQAEQLFMDQTDANGKPIGIMPKVLVVPTALSAKAAVLMSSAELRPVSTAKDVVGNPHMGKFSVATSAYLGNASIAGNSAAAWYLCAAPADLPVMEVAFLNGQESPTVETATADFDHLGIQMRGYFDFGVTKLEYRGGVKMLGAAS